MATSRNTGTRSTTKTKSTSGKTQKYPPAEVMNEGTKLKIRTLVKPKTINQEKYIDSIYNNKITFGEGVAGCGKTWLAVYHGLKYLLEGDFDRLILTRPVVTAGEDLGFMPGTLEEKMAPFLYPLLDALEDHLGKAGAEKLMESGKVLIAPLAFMRGSSFKDSFLIADEAQNMTTSQMRMLLTRFGTNTKYVINGDLHQKDVKQESGLSFAVNRLLGKVNHIGAIKFTDEDVVRSQIVKDMLKHLD